MNEFKVNEDLTKVIWYKKAWVLGLFSIFIPVVGLILWFAFHFKNTNSVIKKVTITILLLILTFFSTIILANIGYKYTRDLLISYTN